MKTIEKILLLFSTRSEAQRWINGFNLKHEPSDPFLFVNQQRNLFLFICGIRAKRLNRLDKFIKQENFKGALMNLGTAGSLESKFKIGEVVSVKKVNRYPHKTEGAIEVVPPDFLSAINFPHGNLITVDRAITDKSRRLELLQFEYQLVDMEGFHLAHTAVKHGLPFSILKVVTDFADEFTEMQFRRNYHRAITKLFTTTTFFLESAIK